MMTVHPGPALIAALLIHSIAMPASGNPLSQHLWSHRPLLIFAAGEGDPALRDMKRALAQRRCDVAERDMVIVEILAEGPDSDDAEALRRRFDVAEDDFHVVLVGKDGGEKLRAGAPPALDDLFALIDGMPMRRREMRESGAGCE